MEIKVIEKGESKLIFELAGADHTFCNILKDYIRMQKGIDVSTYSIEHPLAGVPKFHIEGDNIKEAIDKATKDLFSTNKKIKSQII